MTASLFTYDILLHGYLVFYSQQFKMRMSEESLATLKQPVTGFFRRAQILESYLGLDWTFLSKISPILQIVKSLCLESMSVENS